MKNLIGVAAFALVAIGIFIISVVMIDIPETPHASIEEENLYLLWEIRWLLFGIVFILCGIFLNSLKRDV